MGYKKVQSTRSSDFVQDSEMIAPHISSYIEFYQVNKNCHLWKERKLISYCLSWIVGLMSDIRLQEIIRDVTETNPTMLDVFFLNLTGMKMGRLGDFYFV